MEQLDFLRDLLRIFIIAGAVVFLFQQLRIPAIIGLFVAGTVVGPYGLSLVDEISRVETLADVGIVLLLFTVGLDFTRERLAGAGHLLGAGALQVAIATVGTALCVRLQTDSWGQAIFAGFLISHTSTTVMLKILIDRGELNTAQARIGLGVSIFQDLSVVWMIVLVPALAGGQADWRPFAWTMAKGATAVAAILILARFVLPWVLFRIVRLQSRELFMILIVVVSLGTAWLTAQVGLSLALGAFLAGIALAESEYSHQTLAEAIPFRDVFVSLFFVSIGMLFDWHFVLRHPVGVVAIVAGVLVLKFFSGAIPALAFGYSWRAATFAGAGMAQVGEFAFVLSRSGREAGLLPDEAYQALLAAAILTMALSPFVFQAAEPLVRWGERTNWVSRVFAGRLEREQDGSQSLPLRNHVIVVGYGVNGRNVARGLRRAKAPHLVLEINPLRVHRAHEAGDLILFGDCTRPAVLHAAGIRDARLLVVAISDPSSARRAVQIARQLNPGLGIIVRTRYLREIDELRRAGANEIIPEEFETSIEILGRVLERLEVPDEMIRELEDEIRLDHYGLFRRAQSPEQPA